MRPHASSAMSSSAACTIVGRLCVVALILISMLAVDSPSAHALPRANGSNCSPNWVNNEGALDCFIQGEEEGNNGTPNPHYVGCTPDGIIFCCYDDPKRGQVCEALSGPNAMAVRKPTDAAKLGAILYTQQSLLLNLNKLSKRVDDLEGKLNSKPSP
jgi:hypothetical protein